MKPSDKNKTAATIKKFLSHHHVAVAGTSRNPKKFGNIIFNDLLKKGYAAVPVNPNATEIEGQISYPNLSALPKEVEAIVFVTPPAQTLSLLREATQTGIKYFWIQQGAENPEVLAFCLEHNLQFVSGRCILLHLEPVKGFHAVHKFVSKIFGSYPN